MRATNPRHPHRSQPPWSPTSSPPAGLALSPMLAQTPPPSPPPRPRPPTAQTAPMAFPSPWSPASSLPPALAFCEEVVRASNACPHHSAQRPHCRLGLAFCEEVVRASSSRRPHLTAPTPSARLRGPQRPHSPLLGWPCVRKQEKASNAHTAPTAFLSPPWSPASSLPPGLAFCEEVAPVLICKERYAHDRIHDLCGRPRQWRQPLN